LGHCDQYRSQTSEFYLLEPIVVTWWTWTLKGCVDTPSVTISPPHIIGASISKNFNECEVVFRDAPVN